MSVCPDVRWRIVSREQMYHDILRAELQVSAGDCVANC